MSRSPFTQRVVELIRAVPCGRVATYGQIAALAGNGRAARQVARILHACSEAEGLPWHRVVNREGRVSLPAEGGGDEQHRRLEAEGVAFDVRGRLDLTRFLWRPPGRLGPRRASA